MAEDLSQQERELIANLIKDGKPVPARYIPSISDNPLKTELIWPGKSSYVDSSVLPFQSIEHIDEPRKETVKQYDLFSMSEATGRQVGGWTNKLIWGDNKFVLSSLQSGPVRDQIIANGGSVQGIVEIPLELQELYKTVWEIPQKTLINMARDRAPFVCQSQSLNLFLSEPTYAKISSMHMYAWKCGLKTGCYYLRTKGASTAQKFTVEPTNNCLSCSA